MSFGDNFKREAEEDMLEYDDSAFYYFSMSLLTCIVAPMTFYTIKEILFGNKDLGLDAKNCKCSACQKTIAHKVVDVKRKMWTPNFYFRLLCLALLWMVTVKNFELVSNIKTLQSFDPYEILGVS